MSMCTQLKHTKKIALMTWYHYHNYGTALQAYALYSTISRMGYAVDIVDYRPVGPAVLRPEKNVKRAYLKKAANKVIHAAARRGGQIYQPHERELRFNLFLKEQLTFSNHCDTLADLESLNDVYDTFVCGSDQIWSPSGANPHYFLDFAGDSKLKIAYAPSIGRSKIEDDDINSLVQKYSSRLDFISVREREGANIISSLLHKQVQTNLDPTLLLDAAFWSERFAEANTSKTKYMLIYMLGHNESHWKTAYEIARKLGLSVKAIPVFQRDLRRVGCIKSAIGPAEFVSLIANASYVCTDSFHGVAFSVNLKRDFCVFERFSAKDSANQNTRIYDILNRLGLAGRLFSRASNVEDVLPNVDWGKPLERLASERSKSIEWLRIALSAKSAKEHYKQNVVQNRSLCCGCSSCEAVCPVGAIRMEVDGEGFWRARVNEEQCVSCGKCRQVCPFICRFQETDIKNGVLFSYKTDDLKKRSSSSSGGAAADLAESRAFSGSAVLGARFDIASHGPVHQLILPNQKERLVQFAGSKYMQSKVSPTLKQLVQLVKKDEPLTLFGTPCQIAGMRNLLGNRNDILYIDIICHGVPTRYLYDRYLEWLGEKNGLDLAKALTIFRYKSKGWREKHIYTTDGSKEICLSQKKDPYYLMFEAGQCYARCCYECPWRDKSVADVRLGDYWGPRYQDDKTGVSMVVALTDSGEKAVRLLRASGKIERNPITDYFKSQQTTNFREPVFRLAIIRDLRDRTKSISETASEYGRPIADMRDLMKIKNELIMPIKAIAKWARR